MRLHSDQVANGNWNPDNRKVRFNWNNAGNENPNSGARLEISQIKGSLLKEDSFSVTKFIQPFVIFEISTSCSDILTYILVSIIPISFSVLMRFWRTPVLIRNS